MADFEIYRLLLSFLILFLCFRFLQSGNATALFSVTFPRLHYIQCNLTWMPGNFGHYRILPKFASNFFLGYTVMQMRKTLRGATFQEASVT